MEASKIPVALTFDDVLLVPQEAAILPQDTDVRTRLAREIFHISEKDDRLAALAGIERLKAWFAAIGSPTSLKDAGIPMQDIDRIAENAAVLAQVWQLKDYTREVIAEILQQCR